MCGIAGVRRYGETPITPEEVKVLLCSLEHRGNHATGMALLGPDGIKVHKDHVPAWDFIAQAETEAFLEEHLPTASMAILHTRWATLGNPEDNANNHPFFVNNTAIVHNGSISNHAHLFTSLKLNRSCETDSDIIRGILDHDGITEDGIKELNKMAGSAAIAAFSVNDPDKLLLARSGSPLVYGTSEDKLWWASELGAIQKAVRPWVENHGLLGRTVRTDVAYHTMPDNTAYILSPRGLELRREFKTCTNYRAPLYAGMHQSYATKRKGWKEETAREKARSNVGTTQNPGVTPHRVTPVVASPFVNKTAHCCNETCDAICSIEKTKLWGSFYCHTCKTNLAPIDKYEPHRIRLSK